MNSYKTFAYQIYAWTPYSENQIQELYKIYQDPGRTSEKYIIGQGWVLENHINELFFKGELSSQNIKTELEAQEIINRLESLHSKESKWWKIW